MDTQPHSFQGIVTALRVVEVYRCSGPGTVHGGQTHGKMHRITLLGIAGDVEFIVRVNQVLAKAITYIKDEIAPQCAFR